MLWPQAIAGVVDYARHPTTRRWPLSREGLSSQAFTTSLSKEGTFLSAPFTYVAPYRSTDQSQSLMTI